MVAQTTCTVTTRTVTTRLTCGCTVSSRPGEYATCPAGHPGEQPDYLTRSRRKG